jgi:hypothetical protein
MKIMQRLKNQRGSITLLGVSSIVVALFGLGEVVELGNAKMLERQLDRYVTELAPVALRTELALTENMPDRKGYTERYVDDILESAGMSMPERDSEKPTNEGANLKTKLTFGNMEGDEFVPLDSAFVANPKASDEYIKFSAVAVELWSDVKAYSVIPGTPAIFTPSGKAIYGISEADTESPDIANCFCDKRYEMCLVSDTAGVTADFPGNVGTDGSADRKNYCEYGHVDSHPGDSNKTKYPSVPLAPQWIGKDRAGDEILVDISEILPISFATVLNQEPLKVIGGDDPFSNNYWNFWDFKWIFGGADYYARNLQGDVLKRSDSYDGANEDDYLWSGRWNRSWNKMQVDGYFYVGRTGTCVSGTTASDVPNVSGGLADINNVVTSTSVSEVSRCLSYEKVIGSKTVTKSCPGGFKGMFCRAKHWSGSYTETTNVTGYAQQSCVDFNSNETTRMNFFQWMMSLFFSPFTNIDTSYKQLDCSVQKMRFFSIKIPFLGGGFKWQIS